MVIDDLFRGIHVAVTDFDCVSIRILLSLWSFWKCLSTRAKNLCPILVLTFLLNGGLYQNLLFRCLFFCLLVVGGS